MKTSYLWIIAVLITAGSAFYQKTTGPTYPIKDKTEINGKVIRYKLERSHSTSEDYTLKIETKDSLISGMLTWKRFKSNDSLTSEKMTYFNDTLRAVIPAQPSAGKVQYRVELSNQGTIIPLTDKDVVMRFKNDVPMWILIPHIIFMFSMMLLSTRTGLETFAVAPKFNKLTFITLFFMIGGGMILGPITQKFAFGAFWTGFPFGHDLTDNKTLIALITWIVAIWKMKKSSNPKPWVIGAAIVTFIVFLIPHSVMGSEIDYTKK